MSSNFYFLKWKNVLNTLDSVLQFDLNDQASKAHDQRRCEATLRLSSILARYSSVYNEAVECLHQNLQVQKEAYMEEIINSVEKRILEIKHDLRTLECSECHFVGNGVAREQLTPDNTQLNDVRIKFKRSEHIDNIIKEVLKKVTDEFFLVQFEDSKIDDDDVPKITNWWDDDYESNITETTIESCEEYISEETVKRIHYINLIKSHEKSRHVITVMRRNANRRRIWEKELCGTLVQAPYDLREKSAKLIQLVLRTYFAIKRKKLLEKRKDEILGIRFAEFTKPTKTYPLEERTAKLKKNQQDCEQRFLLRKQKYMKTKGAEIMEDYRDFIRNWFYEWYEKIKIFHELPTHKEGGLTLILNEEIPPPEQWLEEYKKHMQEMAANKKKTALQIKWEKMNDMREIKLKEREQTIQKKLEAELKRKMMKNPNLHPGFVYPTSKTTKFIVKAIEHYHRDWNYLDEQDTIDVRENYVEKICIEDCWKNVKLELLDNVHDDMSIEHQRLKAALIEDYAVNNKKLPTPMKKPKKTKIKRVKTHKVAEDNIHDLVECLLKKGILVDYPKTKLKDFMGDHNFAGEDFRCICKETLPFSGDIRNIWWKVCRHASHHENLLLVGPEGSGKTELVHILASLNDAVLFVLDPAILGNEPTIMHFEKLLKDIKDCAIAVQPSVIYIKDLQYIYSRKKATEDLEISPKLMKRYIIKKLLKMIHKTHRIVVVGGCTEPWKVRSKAILKRFPKVLLLPNSSYSVVFLLIQDWVLRNHEIPKDFDIHSLAYVLQGYSFGYLKEVLQNYLTPESILEIAINGISPTQIHDYIIKDDQAVQCDYSKYHKWYLEKTHWGRKEKQHLEEQREFLMVLEKFAKKNKLTNRAWTSRDATKNHINIHDNVDKIENVD